MHSLIWLIAQAFKSSGNLDRAIEQLRVAADYLQAALVSQGTQYVAQVCAQYIICPICQKPSALLRIGVPTSDGSFTTQGDWRSVQSAVLWSDQPELCQAVAPCADYQVDHKGHDKPCTIRELFALERKASEQSETSVAEMTKGISDIVGIVSDSSETG